MSQQKAKGLGLKYTRVEMGLFEFSVAFVTGDYSKAISYITWLFEDPDVDIVDGTQDFARGRCFYKHGYVPVVWLPKVPATPREYATLAHECIHAARHLFDWALVPTNDSTEEVYAHSVGHLVNGYLEANSGKVAKKQVAPKALATESPDS